MMDSRKFKRRKRPQRDAETKATDAIAPSHKVPVPAKARRLFKGGPDKPVTYKRVRYNADGTKVVVQSAPVARKQPAPQEVEPVVDAPAATPQPEPAPQPEPVAKITPQVEISEPEPVEPMAEPEPVIAAQPEPARPEPDLPEPMQARLAAPAVLSETPEEQTPIWDQLRSIPVDEAVLDRNRIIAATRRDPAHTAFDVLRTRLLQALHENRWHRVAITSPTKDCGKTFTAANLAISLSRQENCRTLLMDLDLRNPSLAPVFGAQKPGSMGDVFRGLTAPQDHFRRLGQNTHKIGRNIALGLNDMRESYASELLQSPETSAALARIEAEMKPDVVLYDMPPALYHDDVMAFRQHFDGVFQIVEVERRLGTETPLLGVVLNKAEGPGIAQYSY